MCVCVRERERERERNKECACVCACVNTRRGKYQGESLLGSIQPTKEKEREGERGRDRENARARERMQEIEREEESERKKDSEREGERERVNTRRGKHQGESPFGSTQPTKRAQYNNTQAARNSDCVSKPKGNTRQHIPVHVNMCIIL